MSPGTRIEYKAMSQINPEAANKAVLEYLKTDEGLAKGVSLIREAGIPRPPENRSEIDLSQHQLKLLPKTQSGEGFIV